MPRKPARGIRGLRATRVVAGRPLATQRRRPTPRPRSRGCRSRPRASRPHTPDIRDEPLSQRQVTSVPSWLGRTAALECRAVLLARLRRSPRANAVAIRKPVLNDDEHDFLLSSRVTLRVAYCVGEPNGSPTSPLLPRTGAKPQLASRPNKSPSGPRERSDRSTRNSRGLRDRRCRRQAGDAVDQRRDPDVTPRSVATQVEGRRAIHSPVGQTRPGSRCEEEGGLVGDARFPRRSGAS